VEMAWLRRVWKSVTMDMPATTTLGVLVTSCVDLLSVAMALSTTVVMKNVTLVETTRIQNSVPVPVGGDGLVQAGVEECANGYGNNANTNECISNCRLARCGDGNPGPGEECDDGNTISGDGCCSGDCRIETSIEWELEIRLIALPPDDCGGVCSSSYSCPGSVSETFDSPTNGARPTSIRYRVGHTNCDSSGSNVLLNGELQGSYSPSGLCTFGDCCGNCSSASVEGIVDDFIPSGSTTIAVSSSGTGPLARREAFQPTDQKGSESLSPFSVPPFKKIYVPLFFKIRR
jgi:cysteine-rich repeat protein